MLNTEPARLFHFRLPGMKMLGKAQAETVVLHPAWEAAFGVENAHESVVPSVVQAVVLITVKM